jgi:ubiquinone/menaquinone biosynthesis C-methylase UbiE
VKPRIENYTSTLLMNRYFGVHVLDGEWHALLPRYLLLAQRIEGKRILDIGCGTGIGSSLLLELGAERVDGVDYRPGVLDLANIKHAKESLTFHTMLWEELDFPDDSFDLVCCLDPDTPVTDPNLLEEVSRVLTDDGEYVCAIERRTIDGFESLLPKYGYTAPAENVQLGQRDEQAPQIGQLGKYFDEQVRILQRPEYNYVFESEAADADDEQEPNPVDYTLCTEDSHIAGVELLFCGPESMDEPSRRTIRLPYYRLAERLGTVIRDLNMRQGPGNDTERLSGPVQSGQHDEDTDPRIDADWDEDTDVRERPRRETRKQNEAGGAVDDEIERLTDNYRRLQRSVQQLREETQSAMVAQERSIDQLVELLTQWRQEELAAEHPSPADGGEVDEKAETGIFERPDFPDDSTESEGLGERAETDIYQRPAALDDEDSDAEADVSDEADEASLEERVEQLLEEREKQQDYIDELEQKIAELEGDADDESAASSDDEEDDEADETDDADESTE